MKFEDLLQETGGFGNFQILILLLLAIPRINLPFHYLLNNFVAVVPPHRCALSDQGEFGNFTEAELLLISIPRESDGTLSSCKMYREPQWHLLENYTWRRPKDYTGGPPNTSTWGPPNTSTWGPPNTSTWGPPNTSTWRPPNTSTWGPPNTSTWRPPNTSTWGPPKTSTLQSCQQGWAYDHSQFTSTIATQWDLVCEQKWLSKASSTFFFIGVMVGAILNGYLSDRYGRRRTLLVCSVLTLVFEMVAAASVNYPMFAVFRALSGMSISAVPIVLTALSVEWVEVNHRSKSWVVTSIFWPLGIMLLSPVAYLIRDWRWLLIAATSPYIFIIISIWWLPESARWLLTKGKVKEVHALLVQCSSMNRQTHLSSNINTEVLSKIAEEENTKTNYSFVNLFSTPEMRKISLYTGLVWFGVAFSYYGISLNITGFGLNMYMTTFIYGAIEIPFKLTLYFFIEKRSRRQIQAWSILVSGFLIGFNTVIPVSLSPLRTTIATLGQGFSGAAFMVLYLYTAELYPTVLRQNGIGYNLFLSRIGVALAPLVLLLDEVWKVLPQVIYCSVAIVCGLVAFLLPETLNVELPDTIKDIEETRSETICPTVDPKEDVRSHKF
ncbi:solute carrier family 22 member 7-like [Lissotriton helveticus]